MIDKISALIKIAQGGHYGRIDIPPSVKGHFDGAAFMSGYIPDKNTNQMIDVESDKRRNPKINFDSPAWRSFSRGLTNNTNRLPFYPYPIQSAAPSGPVKWPEGLNGKSRLAPEGKRGLNWMQDWDKWTRGGRNKGGYIGSRQHFIDSERRPKELNRENSALL